MIVAGPGIAPGPPGYEPDEILLLHPAMVLRIVQYLCQQCNYILKIRLKCTNLSGHVEVAQLVRAVVSYATGREFESLPRHYKIQTAHK